MTWTPGSSFAGSAVLLVMMILPRTASAALGGTVASVDADRVQVVGALTRIVRNDAFALHEIRSASGITIREYVNTSGTVFAVAWQGPWIPDLRQVLGEHFDHYQAAMRAPRRARTGRGSIAIDDAGPVVQMSGHPRAFSGRAYLPALLPQNVALEAIR